MVRAPRGLPTASIDGFPVGESLHRVTLSPGEELRPQRPGHGRRGTARAQHQGPAQLDPQTQGLKLVLLQLLEGSGAVDDHHIKAEPAAAAPRQDVGVRLEGDHGPWRMPGKVRRKGMERSASTATSVWFSDNIDP